MVTNVIGHEAREPQLYRCFFCNFDFEKETITDEHVFPLWLQKKLDLLDKKLTLLNGSTIPYRNLTVPACRPCNNVILSNIEDKVARGQRKGADAIRDLGHQTLFIWLGKIFFGILYKEALLPYQRSSPESGTIIPKQAINSFDGLHRFMQTARTGIDFTSPDTNFHTSILVFHIQQHPDIRGRFNYIDGIPEGFLGIYFDTIGLIFIMDGGAQERLANESMPKMFQHPLHPIQFMQLCSLYMTKARTFTRNPKYVFASGPSGLQVSQMPLQGLSPEPLFSEFDYREYAEVFSAITSIPFSYCYNEDQGFIDFIGDYGNPKYIDVISNPWPEFNG